MIKKYIVRLTEDERETLQAIAKKLKGTSQKVARANILLKADIDGPNWTDSKISDAFSCSTRTVEVLRQRLVTEGFDTVLNHKKRNTPPVPKKLDGKQEAKIIALRLGKPPVGFSNWSLRLLTEKVIALEIVDTVSRETIRKTLKKME